MIFGVILCFIHILWKKSDTFTPSVLLCIIIRQTWQYQGAVWLSFPLKCSQGVRFFFLHLRTSLDMVFSLLRQEYPPILTSGEMLSHPGGWDKPIPEVIHLWRHRMLTPNNLEKSRPVCVLDIFCPFLNKNEKNNHHIEGGTRESHPHIQDLRRPRLGKPSSWIANLGHSDWIPLSLPQCGVRFY